MKHFHVYLYGATFWLYTDCLPLKALMTKSFEHNPRLYRFQLQLMGLAMKILYRKGKENANADFLSRLPDFEEKVETMNGMVFTTITPAATERTDVTDGQPYVPTMSVDTLAMMQRKDKELNSMIRFLEFGKLPLVTQDAENIRNHAPDYKLHNGLLHHWYNHKSRKGLILQLVVPKNCQYAVYQAYHEDSLGGHFGKGKTLSKIKLRYFWVRMNTAVSEWINACQTCQLYKKMPQPKVPMKPHTAFNLPWDMVAMDILGPLKETKSGHRYVIIWSDYLTRFPEAVALKEISANTIGKAFVTEICFRWGCPRTIIHDQGSNFMSRFFRAVCFWLNVYKIHSSPWSPWVQGLVERFNRVIPQMLRCYAREDNWDEFLAPCLFAYRTSIHPAINTTPYHAMMGRDAYTPLDRIFEVQAMPYQVDPESFLASYAMQQVQLWKEAKENITVAQLQASRLYNRHAKRTEYHVGSLVWVIDQTKPIGETKKLLGQYKGPFRIAKLTETNAWLVPVNAPGDKFKESHLNNLKPYHPPYAPLVHEIPSKSPDPGFEEVVSQSIIENDELQGSSQPTNQMEPNVEKNAEPKSKPPVIGPTTTDVPSTGRVLRSRTVQH